MKRIVVLALAMLVAACQGTVIDGTGDEVAARSVRLVTNFFPDPRQRDYQIVPLPSQPADAKVSCPGFYPGQAALDLQFEAGNQYDLYFFARGYDGADLVMGVETPEGETLCNDDGWYDLNPRIRVGQPLSGRYLVWIGTYDGQPAEARLFISEVDQGPQIRDLR